MEIVDTREDYHFKMLGAKTFAVLNSREDIAFCPFCYTQMSFDDDKCPNCGKNIPELIYYHGDDQTWIASGNE